MSQEITTLTLTSEEKKSVEANVRARRTQLALNITRYVTGIAAAFMIMEVIAWLILRPYTQLLASAAVILLPGNKKCDNTLKHVEQSKCT